MDLRQLRLFRSICDAGSIVGAAELERTAPSVIAHHLANLEARIGAVLFERSARGMQPTEAGRKLYIHAIGILRAVNLAEQDVRDTGAEVVGTVEVAMAFSSIIMIGEPFMRALGEQHPNLRLRIAESLSGGTIERFLESGVDLAVAYSPGRDSRLELTPLLEEEMVCMGRTDVIGQADTPLRFDDFLDMRFILPRSLARGRAVLDSTEHQKRLEERAAIHTQMVYAAWNFISAGLGAMLGTSAYLAREVAGPDIAGRLIIEPRITRTLFLCESKDTAPSSAVLVVKKLILDLVRNAVEQGHWPARLLL